MKSFGNVVVKIRHLILIIALVLIIPAVWGYFHTRVNYDILTYLPDSIETIQGQNILMDEFGTGAITMLIVEDKSDREIVALEEKIRQVEHVKKVLWYDSFADITVPKEMLPEKIRDAFLKGNATLLAITYDTSTSSDETMEAVKQSRLPEVFWKRIKVERRNRPMLFRQRNITHEHQVFPPINWNRDHIQSGFQLLFR